MGRYIKTLKPTAALSHTQIARLFQNFLEAAGARYSAELNVDLPIAVLFDGLCRTQEFFDSLTAIKHRLKKNSSSVASWYSKLAELPDSLKAVKEASAISEVLFKQIDFIKAHPSDPLPFGRLSDSASALHDALEEASKKVRAAEGAASDKRNERGISERERLAYLSHSLYEVLRVIRDLLSILNSPEVKLANSPLLWLAGDAGSGKTHLFCDIAKHRLSKNLITVPIMCQQLANADLGPQLAAIAGLVPGTLESFFEQLEEIGRTTGARILLLIDAINEGNGLDLWKSRLESFASTASKFPHVAVAISCRSNFENVIASKDVIGKHFTRHVHNGFGDMVLEATQKFFEHYGLHLHEIPLLREFYNPLFLKLYCRSVQKQKSQSPLRGQVGMKTIIEKFVYAVNDDIARKLGFNPNKKFAWHVIKLLADKMGEAGSDCLPHAEAIALVAAFATENGIPGDLYQNLIKEDLLSADAIYDASGTVASRIVRFTYQKFSDHILVRHLLGKHLNRESPRESFKKGTPLHAILEKPWRYRGLIDAIVIELPEWTSRELFEFVPRSVPRELVVESTIHSMVWREPAKFKKVRSTLKLLNSEFSRNSRLHDEFLKTVVSIATVSNHPLNAKFLHKSLMRMKLTRRDYIWTRPIHSLFQDAEQIERLLRWGHQARTYDALSDASALLGAITLSWMLTSSNRFLRDRATKSLLALLTNRIPVLLKLLKLFENCDDPYVSERMLAIGYGCAMRSTQSKDVSKLARYVYSKVFSGNKQPINALSRDYARGIVLCAKKRNPRLRLSEDRLKPPFKSKWPRLASDVALKKYEVTGSHKMDPLWAQRTLFQSIKGFGDFSRYILGSDYPQLDWVDPNGLTPSQEIAAFKKGLSRDQARLLKEHCLLVEQSYSLRLAKAIGKKEKPEAAGMSEQDVESKAKNVLDQLLAQLPEQTAIDLKSRVLPMIKSPHGAKNGKSRLHVSVLQNYILERVFELGWSVDLFGEFDQEVDYGSRSAHKAERIGKKYQWIAYYEICALLSDHFSFCSRYSNQPNGYEGSWQLRSVRNFDPSFIQPSTEQPDWAVTGLREGHRRYTVMQDGVGMTEWKEDTSVLPDLYQLLEITDPCGSQWLAVDASFQWQEPIERGEDRYDKERRETFLLSQAYLIHAKETSGFKEWARKQHFSGERMPEPCESHKVFLGEMFWSPAYFHERFDGCKYNGWTEATPDLPFRVACASERYSGSPSDYDCSGDERFRVNLPSLPIALGLDLQVSADNPRAMVDPNGGVQSIFIRIQEIELSALLVKKEPLCRLMKEQELGLVWVTHGQKRLIGGGHDTKDWKGHLELSGFGTLGGDDLKLEMNHRLVDPTGSLSG